MRKLLPIVLLSVVVSACTLEQVFMLPEPASTPAAARTDTPAPPPTLTPVLSTPTFTATPTLVGFEASPIAEEEETPAPVVTPLDSIILLTPTPTVQMDGFLFIRVSHASFYKGADCQPSSVSFTVQVADPARVRHVLLFVRFRSMTSERTGKWTNLPMTTIGAGTYIHELVSDQVLDEQFFQTAWVEYQLVATTAAAKEVGRTDIFKERLTMTPCAP
jgi:hypothetical protein